MSDRQESLWYTFQGDSAHSGIPVVAATGDAGVVCIMCTLCGHTFVDGKPFTDESDQIDSGQLAKALYYHRCDLGRKPERMVKSRGRMPA